MKKQKLIDNAIEALKKSSYDDNETAHIQADDILCELLKSLGCIDVVNEFEKLINGTLNLKQNGKIKRNCNYSIK